MARKQKTIVITADNTAKGAASRDIGRRYLLTELPASKAEKWAARAYLAIARAGKEIPPEIASMGMVGFALYGFAALSESKFEDLEPLMDEMMGCVQYSAEAGGERSLLETDIEETDTRIFLRLEVLHLHLGFTLKEWLSQRSPQKPARKKQDPQKSTTPTSPD